MIADYYAEHAEDLLKPRKIESIAGDAQLENHPLGVLMAVEPWNFPYYQMMRIFAPNFAVGDPIVYKHAAITPAALWRLKMQSARWCAGRCAKELVLIL